MRKGIAIPQKTLDELKRITFELFGVEPQRISWEDDPEIPNCQWLVVSVALPNGAKNVPNKRLEWHRRTDILPDCDSLTLLVDIAE